MLKECPEGTILNPKTKRCVKKDGKIGKEVLKQQLSIIPPPEIPNDILERIMNVSDFKTQQSMSKTNHVMAKHFRGKIKSFEKMNTDFMTEYIDTLGHMIFDISFMSTAGIIFTCRHVKGRVILYFNGKKVETTTSHCIAKMKSMNPSVFKDISRVNLLIGHASSNYEESSAKFLLKNTKDTLFRELALPDIVLMPILKGSIVDRWRQNFATYISNCLPTNYFEKNMKHLNMILNDLSIMAPNKDTHYKITCYGLNNDEIDIVFHKLQDRIIIDKKHTIKYISNGNELLIDENTTALSIIKMLFSQLLFVQIWKQDRRLRYNLMRFRNATVWANFCQRTVNDASKSVSSKYHD